MSLTLTDFLAPEEITHVQELLREEIALLNNAELEAIAAIAHQFDQARGDARRRVLLSVLVPVVPTVSGDSCAPTPIATTEGVELAKSDKSDGKQSGEFVPEVAVVISPRITTGVPEGFLTPTEAQEASGVARGSWRSLLERGWIAPAGHYTYNGIKASYFAREDCLGLKERWANRDKEVEMVRGMPVLEVLPAGCILREEALKDMSTSTLHRGISDGKVKPVGYLRSAGVKPMQWPMVVRRSEVEALKHEPRGRKPQNFAKTEEPTPAHAKDEPETPLQEELMPLPRLFTPSPEKEAARRFATHEIVPAPPQPAPRPILEIPEPALDLSEGQRYQVEEAARRMHSGGFWLLHRFVNSRAQYKAAKEWQAESAMGWEPLEWWQRNGLGRWESTPFEPGAVGFGNGTTRSGAVMCATPGGKL